MPALEWWLLGGAILALSGLYFWWQIWLARREFRRWAAAHGWGLTKDRYRFFGGPFRAYTGTKVFRFAARGADGRTRRGHAEIGKYIRRDLGSGVVVRWDEGDEPAGPPA